MEQVTPTARLPQLVARGSDARCRSILCGKDLFLCFGSTTGYISDEIHRLSENFAL